MALTATQLVAAKTVAGSIASQINRSDIPSAQILSEAQEWIYRRLRARNMISAPASLNLAAGTDTLALPTGYIATIALTYTGIYQDVPLERTDTKSVIAGYAWDSASARVRNKPRQFYLDDQYIRLDVPADQAYTLQHVYFYALPELVAGTNETNFLTTRAQRLLRCTCTAFANEWMKNETEKQYWLDRAAAEIEELNVDTDFSALDSYLQVQAL